MRRLWTSAEMSAMLSNPNAGYSTFVRADRVNHNVVCLALGGASGTSWASAQQKLANYGADLSMLKAFDDNYAHIKKQNALLIYVYNTGGELIFQKYGRNLQTFLVDGVMEKSTALVDKSHLSSEPPISAEEQERLILEYKDKYGLDGRSHPSVSALLSEIGDSKAMPPSFSHAKHYVALLLLASEVFWHEMRVRQWNSRVFEEILRSLGEHPSDPKSDPKDEFSLKFFMPGGTLVLLLASGLERLTAGRRQTTSSSRR